MSSSHVTRQNPLPVYAGCFSNSIPLVEENYYTYQSSGWCAGICDDKDKLVLGLSNGTLCWCGDLLPPAQEQVADSRCNTPCQGYDLEDCGGGSRFFTVWLTGSQLNVPNYRANNISSSSTSSSTRSSTARSTTSKSALSTSAPGAQGLSTTSARSTTTTATSKGSFATDQASTPSQKSNDGHGKLLGIVLGVVLGVVALAVLLALLWWIRRRRKREPLSTTEMSPSSAVNEPKESSDVAPQNPENGRQSSTIGALLHPPIFLGGPNTRTVSQTSTTASNDQPFYTPLEESSFADHVAAEPYAAREPGVANATGGVSSTPPDESSNQSPQMFSLPYHAISHHVRSSESDIGSSQDPFTSEASEGAEDAGVGYMSVTTGRITSLGGPAFGGEAEHDHARIGSLLVATREFVARSSDEISMAIGDRIVLVERDDKYSDGWFLGQHTSNGQIGLFPESFTTLN